MRLGALSPLSDVAYMHQVIDSGFDFLELTTPPTLSHLPEQIPDVPLIWQCPPDLPFAHPTPAIREAVLESWRHHLDAAQQLGAALMVLQFHSGDLSNKAAFIQQSIDLLQPITQAARAQSVQPVLRNSPDNRDQLQLLREIVRGVPGLGIALDVAYAGLRVVKNLTPEYLLDSDLGPRIAHVYLSESNGQDPNLRLPLGSLAGIPWPRLVRNLRERYNASITIDVGSAAYEYLNLSRQQFLAWWQ